MCIFCDGDTFLKLDAHHPFQRRFHQGALSEETTLPDIDKGRSYSAMPKPISFRYFKTSPEIIQLAVMPYVRFPLSLRNVEDFLHKRITTPAELISLVS